MNDRFRFRFWDKEFKTMQKYPYIELRQRKSLDAIFDDDRVIFMQCTGLKDKNGKLIYEGDVCEYEFEEIGKQKAIIYFNEYLCAFIPKPLDNFQFARLNNCKIIGNIYENLELLEETK